jgi:hypothetical protein
MGVAREMGRLIRLSYNDHLSVEELTRYVYALDKLRAALESAINIEAQATANAPKPPPAPTTVNILTIPPNTFLDDAKLQQLYAKADSFTRRPLIEHVMAPPEPAAEAVQSEPASVAGPIESSAPEAPAIAPKPVLVHDEELDPRRQRARELGVELLPRRVCEVD